MNIKKINIYMDDSQRKLLILLIKGTPLTSAQLRELIPVENQLIESIEAENNRTTQGYKDDKTNGQGDMRAGSCN